MTTAAIDSLCPYCGVVCQVRYHLDGDRIRWAEGLDGPANRGRLCVKGRFGWDYAHHPDRLTTPLVRRADAPKVPNPERPHSQFRPASWDEALERTAAGLVAIRERHGPQALGGFGTAKGSNEEGYLFQKLVRTGFGTNAVDHCARLCHSSSVVALIDQLGSGAATAAYTQIENADLALVVGVNPSRSFPVAASIFKRAARQRGVKLIVIDPRASEFAEHADIVITHKPGTDIPLLNAMAHTLIAEGLCDEEFLRRRVSGYAAFRRSIEPWSPEAVAPCCGVDAALIREAARAYGYARAAFTLWGMGITQHVHGVRNARCLVNLALLTGNVGLPGTGLHPMRGQNNVQGVSDMGVLPNFLPGYAKVSDAAERARFEQAWGAPVPAVPGLTIVEMINAAALGQIKGLYFMGENPAMSDPDAGHVREALCRLDHLVVQDIFLTETAALADVVLPATSMFEKWGSFTNTNRQVQISRPVLAPRGDAAQDLWILQEIARRLGLNWFLCRSIRGLGRGARPVAGHRRDSVGAPRAGRLGPVSLRCEGSFRRGCALSRALRDARWTGEARPGRARRARRNARRGLPDGADHGPHPRALAHRRAEPAQRGAGGTRAGAVRVPGRGGSCDPRCGGGRSPAGRLAPRRDPSPRPVRPGPPSGSASRGWARA